MDGQDMTDYEQLVKALRGCKDIDYCRDCPRMEDGYTETCNIKDDAAAAIEALQAKVKRLQDKLCDWCAVCPKERRRPEDCELLSETPVMYGPSDAAKMEVQDDD